MVNPEEVRDLTGAARDKWFWDRLDELRSANINLVDEVLFIKEGIEKRDDLLDRARADQERHGQEIIEMGKLINEANERARAAVQEYIANTEG